MILPDTMEMSELINGPVIILGLVFVFVSIIILLISLWLDRNEGET